MHQAIAFAIASEFCRKLAFARKFRSEDKIFAISFAKPFAFASEFLRNAQFAAFRLRFGGKNSLANSRGARQNSHSHSQRYRCDRGALRGALECVQNPVLPFLAFSEKGKENHQKNKDFFIPTEPPISLEKKGKTLKK